MSAKRAVDVAVGQLPLLDVLSGGGESAGAEFVALPDLSVSEAQHKFLRRLKSAVDVIFIVSPNHRNLTDDDRRELYRHLDGRVPHLERIADTRLLLQFNAVPYDEPQVSSFVESLRCALRVPEGFVVRSEYYDVTPYLTEDERARIETP